MTLGSKECQLTRAEFLRALACGGLGAIGVGSAGGGIATATESATDNDRVVVDFDWTYPRCPDSEVGDLDRFFFGDLEALGGFHLDDGDGADETPDGCVLRTDADDATITSLPGGHAAQAETLDYYPRRGDTIEFEHYVHRGGSHMEFRFGVQEDLGDHYAIRFETDSDEDPSLYLLRSDAGTPTILDQIAELSYSTGQFHEFVIEWTDEITVTLLQNGTGTTLSAIDGTYDQGGIGFTKEESATVFSYTHLWNNVRVR